MPIVCTVLFVHCMYFFAQRGYNISFRKLYILQGKLDQSVTKVGFFVNKRTREIEDMYYDIFP